MAPSANQNKKTQVQTTVTKLRQSVEFTLRDQQTYSPIARNIFSLLHFQLQGVKNGDNIFYIQKKDIENIIDAKTNTEDIKIGLNQLRDTTIYIGDIRLSSNLISSHQQINGELFEVEMSEKLMHYFINVQNSYTEYTLENMVNLKKKYSKRIYEILAGFRTLPMCEIGLEKFKGWLFSKALMKDSEKYPRWVDFNRKILDVSIKEINEITELNISYIPKKNGKKVSGIIFYFKVADDQKDKYRQLSLNFDYIDEDRKYLQVLQDKFSLRPDQAAMFLQNYDFMAEKRKMYDIWIRSLDSAKNIPKEYVSNLGAYIAKIYNL